VAAVIRGTRLIVFSGGCCPGNIMSSTHVQWKYKQYAIVMSSMKQTVFNLVGVVALIILVGILVATNPTEAGPFGVLAFFVCLYVVIVWITTYAIFNLYNVVLLTTQNKITKRPPQPLRVLRAYYYASVLSLAPLLIIALQSVGGVSIFDIALVMVFVTLGLFYVAKK